MSGTRANSTWRRVQAHLGARLHARSRVFFDAVDGKVAATRGALTSLLLWWSVGARDGARDGVAARRRGPGAHGGELGVRHGVETRWRRRGSGGGSAAMCNTGS